MPTIINFYSKNHSNKPPFTLLNSPEEKQPQPSTKNCQEPPSSFNQNRRNKKLEQKYSKEILSSSSSNHPLLIWEKKLKENILPMTSNIAYPELVDRNKTHKESKQPKIQLIPSEDKLLQAINPEVSTIGLGRPSDRANIYQNKQIKAFILSSRSTITDKNIFFTIKSLK